MKLQGPDKNEILEILGEAINLADEHQQYGLGDRLFEVIHTLKEEWGIDEEDE